MYDTALPIIFVCRGEKLTWQTRGLGRRQKLGRASQIMRRNFGKATAQLPGFSLEVGATAIADGLKSMWQGLGTKETEQYNAVLLNVTECLHQVGGLSEGTRHMVEEIRQVGAVSRLNLGASRGSAGATLVKILVNILVGEKNAVKASANQVEQSKQTTVLIGLACRGTLPLVVACLSKLLRSACRGLQETLASVGEVMYEA